MREELISTALIDDPDPDGGDKYGMLPLIMEIPNEDDDEDREDDTSGADKRGGGGDDGGDSSEDALIAPSSVEIEVPEGNELPDEDNEAYLELTERGPSDLSPGEAENLINYMRPMSEDEIDFYNESALNRDIERVDDPAHTDDILRAGKGDHGVDKYLQDTSYGDDMSDPDEQAERGDSDVFSGWSRMNPFRAFGRQGDGRHNRDGDRHGDNGEPRRHRHHRHHRRDRDQQLQPGQPGYVAPLPGQPGYGLQPGQPGYGLQPGQPGYGQPVYGLQPGQPGYINPAVSAQVSEYNAQHGGASAPATSTTTQYYPGTSTPIPVQYYPGTSTPVQYYPGTTTPIPTQLPYPQQTGTTPTYVPGSSDTTSDANYISGRDEVKVKVVQGLGRRLAVEHANWLADQDKTAGIAVRPRSYYESVGKLWAAGELKKAKFPTSTTMGNWIPAKKDFVDTARGVLAQTAGVRKLYSTALGGEESNLGGRRHHRHHRHNHGYPQQPGQQEYGLQPWQPGYATQPGQPGYVNPAATTQVVSYNTQQPATSQLPYYPNQPYIMGCDAPKVSMVRGLGRKLVVEHANWLADQDQAAGVAVRPRSYYENVGKLWASSKLKGAKFPTSAMGNWKPSTRDFASAACGLLAETAGARKRFSTALGASVDMGGWSPWGAIKSVAKAAEHGVEKGASLAYRGAKFGLTKPFVYTYKGIKYVGEKAMELALQPIKVVVRRFKNKMVNRKAAELAKQHGLAKPGPTEMAQATSWAKNVTAHSGNRFARAAASLMGYGNEYGVRPVDISLGEYSDEMGLAPALLYPLIVLGAVGLAVILDKVYEAAFKHSSASAADPTLVTADDGTAPAPDAGSPDAGVPDTGAPDAGAPYADDPGSSYDASASPDDGSYDSSGRALAKTRPSLTLEQINRLPPAKRQRAQQLIRSGYIRLA